MLSSDQNLQEQLLTHSSKPVTPYAECSIFSHLTFSWLSPLISIGYKKPLDLDDIPDLSGLDSAKGSFPILKNKLERDRFTSNKLTTFDLVTALIHTTWMDILTTAILAVLCTLASYVGPYLIDAFVQFLNGSRDSRLEGYLFVFTFFVAKVVESLSQRHWFFKLQQGGIRARAALVAMIYQKGLTISSQSKVGQSGGEITNLIAIDAERIGDFGWYIHDPWLVILNLVDLDSGMVQTSPRDSSDVAVEIINGSFSWNVLSFMQASTDQSAVDLTIPNAVGVFAFAVVQLLAVIAIMSQISWQVFLVFIPVIAICIWLQVSSF